MPVDSLSLVRASAWLFAAAGAVGSGLAAYRFGGDRPPPLRLARLHGGLAAAGLALLAYAWAVVGVSTTASVSLVLLAIAAAGGISITRLRRWRAGISGEALAFAHLSVAATGFIALLAACLRP